MSSNLYKSTSSQHSYDQFKWWNNKTIPKVASNHYSFASHSCASHNCLHLIKLSQKVELNDWMMIWCIFSGKGWLPRHCMYLKGVGGNRNMISAVSWDSRDVSARRYSQQPAGSTFGGNYVKLGTILRHHNFPECLHRVTLFHYSSIHGEIAHLWDNV